jgi:hypothetical protein
MISGGGIPNVSGNQKDIADIIIAATRNDTIID